MTPELLSAIRSILLSLGAYAVGKGWLESSVLDTAIVGIMGLVAAWGVYAKRPSSPEALVIAKRVNGDA